VALSTRSIADISHWPKRREFRVFTAPGAVCPANIPPHKQADPLTVCASLCDGVAATQDNGDSCHRFWRPGVLPQSVGTEGLVAPAKRSSTPNYSIDTVRRLKQSLKKSTHFFPDLNRRLSRDAQWRDARAFWRNATSSWPAVPGFSLRDVAESLPQELRLHCGHPSVSKQPAKGDLVLPASRLHLLKDAAESIRDHNSRRSGSKQPLAKC